MSIQQPRGFIPLVAIILLGLVAIAGGVAATVYVRGEVASVEETTQETTASASVSAQVATSTAPEAPGVLEGQIVQVRATISQETRAICEDAMDEALPSAHSLIGDIQILCQKLGKPAPDSAEQQEAWVSTEGSLAKKWALWLQTHGRDN